MFNANFGFKFDTQEKADEFNDGAWVCFSGCRNRDDPPDKSCCKCCLVNECEKVAREMGKTKIHNVYEICHELLDEYGNTIDVIELASYGTHKAAINHIDDYCSDCFRIRTIRHYQYEKDEYGNESNYHLVMVYDEYDREE